MSRYQIDAWSVARHSDPLAVVEALVARTSTPGWERDSLCRHCEHWTPSMGEGKRPVRPGANALESCSGCWFSHLDPLEPTPGQIGDELALLDQSIPEASGRRKQELRRRAEHLRALRAHRQEQAEKAPARTWRPPARYTEFRFINGRHEAVIPPPVDSEPA